MPVEYKNPKEFSQSNSSCRHECEPPSNNNKNEWPSKEQFQQVLRKIFLPLFSETQNSQKVNGNLGSKPDVYKVSAEK